MNIRSFFNRNPVPIGTAVVLIAVVALWFSFSQSFGQGSVPAARYFTTDDGPHFSRAASGFRALHEGWQGSRTCLRI